MLLAKENQKLAFVLSSRGKLRVGIATKVSTKRSHLFASHDLYITVTTLMWRCFEKKKKKKGCNKSWMKKMVIEVDVSYKI